jgi:hypothetical protein
MCLLFILFQVQIDILIHTPSCNTRISISLHQNVAQILSYSTFGRWKAWCQVLTLTPDIVAEIYHGLPQLLQANARLARRIRKRLLLSTSFRAFF